LFELQYSIYYFSSKGVYRFMKPILTEQSIHEFEKVAVNVRPILNAIPGLIQGAQKAAPFIRGAADAGKAGGVKGVMDYLSKVKPKRYIHPNNEQTIHFTDPHTGKEFGMRTGGQKAVDVEQMSGAQLDAATAPAKKPSKLKGVAMGAAGAAGLTGLSLIGGAAAGAAGGLGN
jgi:hypothetical protein